MFKLEQWITINFPDRKEFFQWVEVASCPDPKINGEVAFANSLKEVHDFDVIIDVGASNSPYVEMFQDKELILFDTRGISDFSNTKTVTKFVGTKKGQELLRDYISSDKKYFIKIDVNGSEMDVIKTMKTSNFDNIICLQFEYDKMWKDNNCKLIDAINLLPYDDFYCVEHNGLRKLTSYPDDSMYRNIVCGNINFDKISTLMNAKSILKNGKTQWNESDYGVRELFYSLKWWSENELKKYTAERRKDSGFPLTTFVTFEQEKMSTYRIMINRFKQAIRFFIKRRSFTNCPNTKRKEDNCNTGV